jgi:hypothetical protein
MLFRKTIEPRCLYCKRGSALDEGRVACPKRGVVPAGEHCRAFQYDPLKRVPPKPAALDLSKLKDEDFSL